MMQIGHIENATRILGRSQGYEGLPIRDEVVSKKVGGESNGMVSAWIPTPKELAAMIAGASVHVTLLGTDHPPILVDVGDVKGDK
jgi:hypothetical protein